MCGLCVQAVKTVHNVSKANKRWLDQKRRELQRQAELIQRLNQLKARESGKLPTYQLTCEIKLISAVFSRLSVPRQMIDRYLCTHNLHAVNVVWLNASQRR